MTVARDLEEERVELLRRIEAALPAEAKEALKAASRLPAERKVLLATNEVGSEYADER